MIVRLRRHDPFWEEGKGARRTHRRVQFQGLLALAMAIVACGVTAAAWMQLLAPLANQFGSASSASHALHAGTMTLREEGQMRTLITNGTIVTADASYGADVLIDGETIAAIGADWRRTARRPTRRSIERSLRDPGRDRRPHPHGAAVRRHVRQGHVRDRDSSRGLRRHDVDRRLRVQSRARACARASMPGTPRPRATRSPTTAST
jgi:hypothetical protein